MKRSKLLSALLAVLLTGCAAFFSPQVSGITPADNAEVNTGMLRLTVRFSKPMDRDSAQSAFTLSHSLPGGARLEGVFSWTDDFTLEFIPLSNSVRYPAVYSVRISTAARDQDGNALAVPFFSLFRLYPGLSMLQVTGASPSNGAAHPVCGPIALYFNTGVDIHTARAAFSLTPHAEGTVSCPSNALVFTPAAPLENGRYYTLRCTTDLRGTNGASMAAEYTALFMAGTDYTAPLIAGVYTNILAAPLTNGDNTLEKTLPPLTVRFNVPMDTNSVLDAFTVTPAAPFTLSWSAPDTLTVNWGASLLPSTNYRLQLAREVKSLSGREAAAPLTFDFYTGGPLSRPGSILSVSLSNGGPAFSRVNVNQISLGGGSLAGLQISFSAVTNISLLSLYSRVKAEYLFGPGGLLSPPTVNSVYDLSANLYLVTIGPLTESNTYRVTLPGQTGGITDVLDNPIQESHIYIITVTN